jgi:hypothetical protein
MSRDEVEGRPPAGSLAGTVPPHSPGWGAAQCPLPRLRPPVGVWLGVTS